jgi:hypothetical protein
MNSARKVSSTAKLSSSDTYDNLFSLMTDNPLMILVSQIDERTEDLGVSVEKLGIGEKIGQVKFTSSRFLV